MSKKWIGLCLIMAGMLTGCEKSADKIGNLPDIAVESNEETTTGIEKKEINGETSVVNEQITEKYYPMDSRIQEILQVYELNQKSKVLALGEENQLVLCEMTDNHIYTYQFELEPEKSIENCSVLSCQDDIILFIKTAHISSGDEKTSEDMEGLVLTSISSTEEERWIYVFDQELELKERCSVSETDTEITALALNQKEGFLAGANGEIYHYTLENGKGEALNQDILVSLKDITIDEMQINEKQDKIVFLGCELEQDKKNVYGWIDLKKETVELQYTETAYGNHLYMEKDIAYITDGEIPYKNIATGIIKCMDLSKETFFDFQVDNLESTAACLSKNMPRLLAKSEILSNEDNTVTGYTLRIYDFSDGEILYESRWEDKGYIIMLFSGQEGFYIVTDKDGETGLYYISA